MGCTGNGMAPFFGLCANFLYLPKASIHADGSEKSSKRLGDVRLGEFSVQPGNHDHFLSRLLFRCYQT